MWWCDLAATSADHKTADGDQETGTRQQLLQFERTFHPINFIERTFHPINCMVSSVCPSHALDSVDTGLAKTTKFHTELCTTIYGLTNCNFWHTPSPNLYWACSSNIFPSSHSKYPFVALKISLQWCHDYTHHVFSSSNRSVSSLSDLFPWPNISVMMSWLHASHMF